VRAERLDEVLGLLAEIKYNEAPISPRRGDAAEAPPAPAAPEAVAAD
jgi:hypothetical protein